MEFALRQAKARLSELVSAVQKGERVVITKYGEPVAELVRVRRRGGIDLEKLAEDCKQAGIEESDEGWPEEFDDPSFSREVLGLKQHS